MQPRSFQELFERDCPYYLSIGMTWEQYWYGDVWMVEFFREAERLRQERINVEAWVNGMYVYDAIGRMSPVLHSLSKKGTKPIPYPSKPYEISNRKKTKEEKNMEEENERLKAIFFFKNWVRTAQKNFEK